MARYTDISILSNENKKLASVGAKYYATNSYPEIPLNANDIYVITEFGDRLDILAKRFYKDVELYWVIASANPDVIGMDSLAVPGGVQLRIPVNLNGILSTYNRENELGRGNGELPTSDDPNSINL